MLQVPFLTHRTECYTARVLVRAIEAFTVDKYIVKAPELRSSKSDMVGYVDSVGDTIGRRDRGTLIVL